MSVATGESIESLEKRFADAGYGDFKSAVGESVVELLTPIRERFEGAGARTERELQRLLAMGAEKGAPTRRSRRSRRCTTAWAFVRSPGGKFFGAARPKGL